MDRQTHILYRLCSIIVIAIISLVSTVLALEPVSKSYFGGVALGGHDTVQYHELYRKYSSEEQSKRQIGAIKGSKGEVYEWLGAKWYFSSASERERFVAEPHKYRPEFNGYCANALSLGEGLVRTDGTHWQFFGGKLYIFASAKGRKRWLEGKNEEYLLVARKAWKDILVKRDKKK